MSSIRRRMLLLLLLGPLVILLLGDGGVYWLVRHHLFAQLDASLLARARAIADLVIIEDGRLELEMNEGGGVPPADIMYVIVDRRGDVVSSAPAHGSSALPVLLAPRDTIAWRDVELPDDIDGRAVSLRFTPRSESDAEASAAPAAHMPLVITVAQRRTQVDRALAALALALVAIGAATALTMAVFVLLGVRLGLAPLTEFSRRLRGIDAESLDRRIDATSVPRELQPVHAELNRLLDRLEQAMAQERRFTDAAAHELRTPLAELRATAEVAVRWPDAKRAAQAFEEILGIGTELERLVESLLRISRARADRLDAALETVEVPALIDAELKRLHEAACAGDVRVERDLPATMRIETTVELFRIIIRNLLENAVSYTPAHGVVTIRSGNASDQILVIENGPVSLARSELERMFQPFWRGDVARSERQHTGLGLAIVRALAPILGVTIDATMAAPDRLALQIARSQHAEAPRG